MSYNILKIHPNDNVLVALTDLEAGSSVNYKGNDILIQQDVPAKHKFAETAFQSDDEIYMYGIIVGRALSSIAISFI